MGYWDVNDNCRNDPVGPKVTDVRKGDMLTSSPRYGKPFTMMVIGDIKRRKNGNGYRGRQIVDHITFRGLDENGKLIDCILYERDLMMGNVNLEVKPRKE